MFLTLSSSRKRTYNLSIKDRVQFNMNYLFYVLIESARTKYPGLNMSVFDSA